MYLFIWDKVLFTPGRPWVSLNLKMILNSDLLLPLPEFKNYRCVVHTQFVQCLDGARGFVLVWQTLYQLIYIFRPLLPFSLESTEKTLTWISWGGSVVWHLSDPWEALRFVNPTSLFEAGSWLWSRLASEAQVSCSHGLQTWTTMPA